MTATPHSVGRDQPLRVAHALMREHEFRHLPVLDGGKLVGVISERDLYFLETFEDVSAGVERVEEAMTKDVYCVPADTPMSAVVREMWEHKYGCAVVVEQNKVVGIFTTTDALRALDACLG